MKCAKCGLELLGFVTCQGCGHKNDDFSRKVDALALVGQWSLVKDSLPELLVPVWLWEEGRGPWIGGRGVDSDGWVWCCSYNTIWHNGQNWDGDMIYDDNYHPTHWMPLPDLPNDKPDLRGG